MYSGGSGCKGSYDVPLVISEHPMNHSNVPQTFVAPIQNLFNVYHMTHEACHAGSEIAEPLVKLACDLDEVLKLFHLQRC